MRIMFMAALMALVANSAAAVTLFKFDEFKRGEVIDAISKDGLSATVSATGGVGEAVAFNTKKPTGGDTDLASPISDLDGNTKNFKKVVIIQENNQRFRNGRFIPDDNAGGGSITFIFDTLISFLSVDILDVEEPGVDIFLDGVLLMAAAGESADHRFATATNNVLRLGQELRFEFEGSGALDNLLVQAPQSVSQVPLPAGGALLLTGLAGFGFFARRRRAA